MNKIEKLYHGLLKLYGPQGWWPLLDHCGTNPTKTGSISGYHPGDYSYPKNKHQQFEICVGAILTQNTNWINVEKALLNLKQHNILNPTKLTTKNQEAIKTAIRPSGYFNQKTKKLIIFAHFFRNLPSKKIPTRNQLLELWGVGPETADSILLYAFKQPEFVIDAYTKRILLKENLIQEKATYDQIKQLFQKNLKPDYTLFQEYHALLVEHAKRYHQKKK